MKHVRLAIIALLVSLSTYADAGISGARGVCAGDTVTLTDAAAGGTWSSSNTAVAIIDTAGVVTGISSGTAVITYYLAGSFSDTATITVKASPAAYHVTGGGTFCAGDTIRISLSNSQRGFGYQLLHNDSVISYQTGKDTALVFAALTDSSAVYSVVARDSATACTAVMNGTVRDTVNPAPDTSSLVGGGHYCSGGAGQHIYLRHSKTGFYYQLHYFYTDSPATAIFAGNDTTIDFGLQAVSGLYKAVATNPVTGCKRTMPNVATIAVDPLPVVFMLSGGGLYCSNDGGANITLSGSQTGVKYNLYYGSTLNFTIVGTGDGIGWSAGAVGTYSVTAVSVTSGCGSNMAGSVSISKAYNPSVYKVTGGGGVWRGAQGVHVGINSSDAGVNYHLYKGGFFTGIVKAGNGMPLDFGIVSEPGIYTVQAFNNATGCGSLMDGTAVVVADPQVHVFPNPSRDELNIRMDASVYSSFVIFNAMGHEMISGNITDVETSVDIKWIPAGLYYIEFRGDHGKNVQKLVKL